MATYCIFLKKCQCLNCNNSEDICPCVKCVKIGCLLKQLQNCILCSVWVQSLFCSVQVYISLHFLPIENSEIRKLEIKFPRFLRFPRFPSFRFATFSFSFLFFFLFYSFDLPLFHFLSYFFLFFINVFSVSLFYICNYSSTSYFINIIMTISLTKQDFLYLCSYVLVYKMHSQQRV